jgi:glycerol-3-phosphate dehydrogenase
LVQERRVLAFFADDGRLFFVIPMGSRTCIGTTDTLVSDPTIGITDEDVAFVLDNINKRLKLHRPLTTADIIATRCGVRPLAVKGESGGGRDFLHLSREHVVEIRREDAHISIFGGKLTDCLNVGSEVSKLVRSLGIALPYPHYKWYGEPPDTVRESRSGSASGSVGWTDTFDEIRGRIWSPEIKIFKSGQYRQACSGEWPLPVTTVQS